jgi:NADPH-dependent 2,4-dienoyl-CoA reductase/sulfur reductase-like enzyme
VVPDLVRELRKSDGRFEAILESGRRVVSDTVVLATGYKPDMNRVPYLTGIVDRLQLADGFPVLDDHFQSSLPGLFITGFPAT